MFDYSEIQRALRVRYTTGTRIGEICEATGMTHNTVSRFIHNETRFPRFETVCRLAMYAGYEINFVPPKMMRVA